MTTEWMKAGPGRTGEWQTRRQVLVAGLAALVGFGLGGAEWGRAVGSARAAAGTPLSVPTAPVEALHAALLDAMRRAETLGLAGRMAVIEPVARAVFDFDRMAQVAGGSAWRGASPEDREAFAAAFARQSIATYATRFDGWSGQRFETLGSEPGPRETTLVQTRLVGAGDEPVALTYVVARVGDRVGARVGDREGAAQGWRIVDVLLRGSISELAVRRSEYDARGRLEGLAGLTAAITTQTDRLLASQSG